MRGELVNGLAGARKIYTQLKQGKQREQELRATNSILQAKIASSSSSATGEGERQVRETVGAWGGAGGGG